MSAKLELKPTESPVRTTVAPNPSKIRFSILRNTYRRLKSWNEEANQFETQIRSAKEEAFEKAVRYGFYLGGFK